MKSKIFISAQTYEWFNISFWLCIKFLDYACVDWRILQTSVTKLLLQTTLFLELTKITHSFIASSIINDNTTWNQKVLEAITTGNVRDKNTNFATYTEHIPCRKKIQITALHISKNLEDQSERYLAIKQTQENSYFDK